MHRKLHFQNDDFWPILAIFVKFTPKILPWEKKFAPGGATGVRARFLSHGRVCLSCKICCHFGQNPRNVGGTTARLKNEPKNDDF